MTPNRCGDCKWYEPTRNPDTGRVMSSQDGKCAWPVTWPDLPKAFRGARFPMRLSVWRENTAPCIAWQAKAKPERQKPPALDLPSA